MSPENFLSLSKWTEILLKWALMACTAVATWYMGSVNKEINALQTQNEEKGRQIAVIENTQGHMKYALEKIDSKLDRILERSRK